MKLCKGRLCKRSKQVIKNICCKECDRKIFSKCKYKCTYWKHSSVFNRCRLGGKKIMACRFQYFDNNMVICSKDEEKCPFKVPSDLKCKKCERRMGKDESSNK